MDRVKRSLSEKGRRERSGQGGEGRCHGWRTPSAPLGPAGPELAAHDLWGRKASQFLFLLDLVWIQFPLPIRKKGEEEEVGKERKKDPEHSGEQR